DFIFKPSKSFILSVKVINSDNTPAENAKLTATVFQKHKQSEHIGFSDAQGEFAFSGIDRVKLDSVRLSAEWKNKEVVYTVMPGDRRDPILTALQSMFTAAGANPLQFTFYTLECHSIDFLMESMVDHKWSSNLSSDAYIISNTVFK